MKISLLFLAVMGLAACSPHSSDATAEFQLPEEMKDCRVYEMVSSTGSILYAIRCPKSITSALPVKKGGKTTTYLEI